MCTHTTMGEGLTLTKTGEVRGYQMIACGKQRNERIELAGGRRKTRAVGRSLDPLIRSGWAMLANR